MIRFFKKDNKQAYARQERALRQIRRNNILRQIHLDSTQKLTSHVFLMGASGSGKSSLIKRVMKELLDCGFPCIWFTVKNSEPIDALHLIGSSKMKHRLIHLKPGYFTFNFAAYELGRVGGGAASLAKLLERLSDMLNRQSSGGEDAGFWRGLFSACMEHAATICHLAFGEQVTLEDIYKLINLCPASLAQLKTEEYKKQHFYTVSSQAQANISTQAEAHAFEQAATFFLHRVATIGEKARGAMITSTSNVLGPLLRSPVHETLCAPESTFTPELALAGYCVVVDFPILTYGAPALLLQNLISIMVMECALRNSAPEHVTIFVKDEFQLLCAAPEFECMAMSVSRAHGICMLAAVQSLPLLRVAMGGNQQGEQYALSLLGNFNTQAVFANQCSDTCSYYNRAWGQHREDFVSINETKPDEDFDLMRFLFGPDNFLFSVSPQLTDRCPVENFINLRRGGKNYRLWVDMYLTQGGMRFGPDGNPFKLVSFKQI